MARIAQTLKQAIAERFAPNDPITTLYAEEESQINRATKVVSQMREHKKQGKRLAPWGDRLLSDLNRHPDMSMVAVYWVLKEQGAIHE